ncbi:hypothetical protein STEG23_033777 [Scotinomys teguina]
MLSAHTHTWEQQEQTVETGLSNAHVGHPVTHLTVIRKGKKEKDLHLRFLPDPRRPDREKPQRLLGHSTLRCDPKDQPFLTETAPQPDLFTHITFPQHLTELISPSHCRSCHHIWDICLLLHVFVNVVLLDSFLIPSCAKRYIITTHQPTFQRRKLKP